ncbi:excinuclease ABC subunit UvrA [Patescibacteria group bacterium]
MENLEIKGAREHNLKNIDVKIPRDKFTVITGLSGSGKSSLAFDTIYAEGQRRYVESLSAYARQFLGMMEKPDVDQIDGLSPAISIDQKSASKNPRSTVGTITEIYDYLRLLFARVGQPHCPKCNRAISKQTIGQIIKRVAEMPRNTKIMVIAPVIKDRKGEHSHVLAEIKKAGYIRLRIDGKLMEITDEIDLDKNKKHTIEVIVDRLRIDPDTVKKRRSRLANSLETALELGNGIVTVNDLDNKKETLFSEHFSCKYCDLDLPEINPRNFSFNSPHGACPNCTGLGVKLEIDPELVVPNPRLTIAEGAIRPWSRSHNGQSWYMRILDKLAKKHDFSLNVPFKDLPEESKKIVLFGSGGETITVEGANQMGHKRQFETTYEGVIPNLERRYKETNSDFMHKEIEKYMATKICPTCNGKRLKPEILGVTLGDKSIIDVTEFTIEKSKKFFALKKGSPRSEAGQNEYLKLSQKQIQIAEQILKEINKRLDFLIKVGLSYLTLDRPAATLAGGEAQRIRLATQIGSGLTGILYILDEPSIGLHQRDNMRLIETLKGLRDLGNTVIVVEHDEETILSADHVIDIGPGAGKFGGEVIAEGTPAQVKKNPKSLTGRYLSHKEEIVIPDKYHKGNSKVIEIKGAGEHNLKNLDVEIPLGKFVCVSGVSGSGKSTLINEILGRALAKEFHNAKTLPGKHKKITGTENLDKVISIDQSPIGRSPRSNPATYTGVFTDIRKLFAETEEAKIRGYKQGRFSFNVKGGRCEACKGDGIIKIEMHFLPDVYVPCEECKGKRYNEEALEIHYKGKNIADVLDMTVREARNFFRNIPSIKRKMDTLYEVGLSYIHLGQPATTLSGGEAQRIKLATELSRHYTGNTLYILDEPTTGLHFEDVKRLLHVLKQLVEKGNTVLVIEHNLDVLKTADWVIDLGPDGGGKGGEVVAVGTPKQVSKVKKSYTGQFLSKYYKNVKV